MSKTPPPKRWVAEGAKPRDIAGDVIDLLQEVNRRGVLWNRELLQHILPSVCWAHEELDVTKFLLGNLLEALAEGESEEGEKKKGKKRKQGPTITLSRKEEFELFVQRLMDGIKATREGRYGGEQEYFSLLLLVSCLSPSFFLSALTVFSISFCLFINSGVCPVALVKAADDEVSIIFFEIVAENINLVVFEISVEIASITGGTLIWAKKMIMIFASRFIGGKFYSTEVTVSSSVEFFLMLNGHFYLLAIFPACSVIPDNISNLFLDFI